MVNIFATNSYNSGARYIHSRLSQVDQSMLDVRHIVIVPDRCSLEAERQLLATVGGSFNIIVLTFSRLANKVLSSHQYLSKQAGIVALSTIIEDNISQLQCFAKGAQTVGFVESIYDTICQLKYCQVSPDQLLADHLPEHLATKLHDIGLIYTLYLQYMEGRYVDSADKLELLCSQIEHSQLCIDGYFYFYDFDNMTSQEFAIVSKLIQYSRGVSVACCVSDSAEDRHLYLNDIYMGMTRVCAELSVTPNITRDSRHVCRHVQHIAKSLFQYKELSPMDNDGFVSVFEGNTVVNEVYQLACKIARHVRQGGRYRDFFVITSDVNVYSNAIHTIMGQFGIPYFCDMQYCLAEHVYCQLILDYLYMCKNNLQMEYVHSIVKNPLMQYGEQAYHFVNYTIAYNINHTLSPFTLGREGEYYDVADSVRASLSKIYIDNTMPRQCSAVQYVHSIRQLVQYLNLDERMAEFANQQLEGGMAQYSKVTMQVADKVEQVLDSLADVLGDRVISIDQLIHHLANGLSAVYVNVLPTHSDSVIFANMAKSRKHDIKILALLGANNTKLPMVKKDTHLLTDYNMSAMTQCGIKVQPSVALENKRERFSLYQLLLEPSMNLHISYSNSIAGDSVLPSPFVDSIMKMFVHNGKPLTVEGTDHGIYSYHQALSKVISNRQRLLDNRYVGDSYYQRLHDTLQQDVLRYGHLSDVQNLRIDNGKELMLGNASSITKVTTFYGCPYKYYHRYGLGVRPPDKASLDANIIGDILHKVLELYIPRIEEGVDSNTVFDEVLYQEEYRAVLEDRAFQLKLNNLRTECSRLCQVVAQHLRDSSFVCAGTEVDFGRGELHSVKVPYIGGVLELVGKIDRMDTWGDMFIVIDYKSGSMVDYSEHQLYIGNKLQLLVYLEAVMTSTNMKPAGYYYFQLHNEFGKKSANTRYTYVGRTVDDIATIRAIDHTIDNDKSDRLGAKLNKNGSLHRSSNIITANQIQAHIDYSIRMIAQYGHLVSQGYIAMTPYEGQCAYCDYREICDFGDIYTHVARNIDIKITASDILQGRYIDNLHPAKSIQHGGSDD